MYFKSIVLLISLVFFINPVVGPYVSSLPALTEDTALQLAYMIALRRYQCPVGKGLNRIQMAHFVDNKEKLPGIMLNLGSITASDPTLDKNNITCDLFARLVREGDLTQEVMHKLNNAYKDETKGRFMDELRQAHDVL